MAFGSLVRHLFNQKPGTGLDPDQCPTTYWRAHAEPRSPCLRRHARFVNYYGQASCTAGRASFITGRIPIRTSLSAVLAPGDPNGLTKQTPTIAQYLK